MPVVADEHRLWVCAGASLRVVPLVGVEQVWRDGSSLFAAVAARLVRVAGAGEPSARVWHDEGYLYHQARDGAARALEVLARGETWAQGPAGAILVGERLGRAQGPWVRAGAPGRVPVALPRLLQPHPVRWSRDGARIAGLDLDEAAVVIDLRDGSVAALPGVPVGVDTWHRGGRIVRRGRVVRRGIAEATSARWGDRLAGPAGRVWDLTTLRPAPRSRIALGATVATPDRFVTVRWDTSEGWSVPHADARPTDRFVLPIDPDDTVVSGGWIDGEVRVSTALGATFRIVGSRVEPVRDAVPAPEGERDLETPVGPFVGREHQVGPNRVLWNDDGWLLAIGGSTSRPAG